MPLDPEEQAEYRANREIVTSHYAFEKMQQDAKERRSFSNLVAEFTTDYNPDHPLKIIGGQHRYEAIRKALENGVDEYHGVKVYFGLDSEQRLDVQLISTTIPASVIVAVFVTDVSAEVSCLASPKSRILIRPSLVIRTLSGFRSR